MLYFFDNVTYLSAFHFAHTSFVNIFSITYVFPQCNLQHHADGLALQLVLIPLVSSIFIIMFSPYLYICTY